MTTSQIIPAATRLATSYGARAATTLAEERREVFDSVRQALRREEPDDDRRLACAYLLRHLARTSSRS